MEYDVSADREKAKEMIQKSGQMGVPVILVDGEQEAKWLAQDLPDVDVEHCPPGADLETFLVLPESNGPSRVDPPILLFTGTW